MARVGLLLGLLLPRSQGWMVRPYIWLSQRIVHRHSLQCHHSQAAAALTAPTEGPGGARAHWPKLLISLHTNSLLAWYGSLCMWSLGCSTHALTPAASTPRTGTGYVRHWQSLAHDKPESKNVG